MFRRDWFNANPGDLTSPINVQYGDGSLARPAHTVTSVNKDEDWFIAEATVRHTYPSSGPYTFYMGICCRIANLVNNGNNVGFGEGIVDLRERPDGSVNNAPITSLSPLIDVLEGKENKFFVTASDPDGDTLKFSLATAWDGNHPQGLSIDENTGEVTFTPGTGIGTNYATQIAISDGSAVIFVDFLMRVVEEQSSCQGCDDLDDGSCGSGCSTDGDCAGGCTCQTNEGPAFIEGTPWMDNPGECLVFPPGVETCHSFFVGSENDGCQTVTLSASGQPSGSSVNTVEETDKGTKFELCWEPSPEQTGSRQVTFQGVDQQGVQGRPSSVCLEIIDKELTPEQESVTVNEGSTASINGEFRPFNAGDDVKELSASVGTIVLNADGTWTWSFTPVKGPDDSQHVALVAEFNDGVKVDATVEINVLNVAPTVEKIEVGEAIASQMVELHALFSDPGVKDTHTAEINWGDGTIQHPSTAKHPTDADKGLVDADHVYGCGGNYTVTVTVTDDAGEFGRKTTVVTTSYYVGVLFNPGDDEDDKVKPLQENRPGAIRVGILSSKCVDVTSDVVVESLRLGTLDHLEGEDGATVKLTRAEDVNGDGETDLLVHFEGNTGIDSEKEIGTIRVIGQTINWIPIKGKTQVRPVGTGNRGNNGSQNPDNPGGNGPQNPGNAGDNAPQNPGKAGDNGRQNPGNAGGNGRGKAKGKSLRF